MTPNVEGDRRAALPFANEKPSAGASAVRAAPGVPDPDGGMRERALG